MNWIPCVCQKIIPLIIPTIYITYHPTEIIIGCLLALLSLEIAKPEIK